MPALIAYNIKSTKNNLDIGIKAQSSHRIASVTSAKQQKDEYF